MQPLRFVNFLAPGVLPVYQFIAAFVGEKLGIQTEVLVGDSHDQFAALRPDMAFICGLPYVLMRQTPAPVEVLAAPVLQGERYGGRPIYFSDVVVHRDSPFQTFADLRGASWAYNEAVSQSGYGITRHHLLQMGETDGFFREVIHTGWHQRSLELIAAGEIDSAAIDSQVLTIFRRDDPALMENLRVIDSLGPSTIQPVIARATLDKALKADIQAALLALSDDAVAREQLSRGFFDRFVAMSDADYDDIRAMLAAAEAADFLTIR